MLIVIGLVASGIARGARRRIGHNRIERVRCDHAGDREVVHRQGGVGLAHDDAPRHDARGGALRQAHAVANQENNLFGAQARRLKRDYLKIPLTSAAGVIALQRRDAEDVYARAGVPIGAK